MIYEFTTLGSCSSRNIFNSQINPGYKKFFKINPSVEAVSLISLMSKSMDFDRKLLDSNHEYDNICVKQDLEKTYLKYLTESHNDYLIMDTYFDVSFSTLLLPNGCFITDSPRIRNTSVFRKIKDHIALNVILDFDKFFKYWSKSCNSFFKFIENKVEETQVILNCSRPISVYLENDNYFIESKFEKEVALNKYRDILDRYILEHFDVEVLFFNKNTLLDKNHVFGFNSSHYTKEYYIEKTAQLNEITIRNQFFKNQEDDSINNSYREIRKKFALNLIENGI